MLSNTSPLFLRESKFSQCLENSVCVLTPHARPLHGQASISLFTSGQLQFVKYNPRCLLRAPMIMLSEGQFRAQRTKKIFMRSIKVSPYRTPDVQGLLLQITHPNGGSGSCLLIIKVNCEFQIILHFFHTLQYKVFNSASSGQSVNYLEGQVRL